MYILSNCIFCYELRTKYFRFLDTYQTEWNFILDGKMPVSHFQYDIATKTVDPGYILRHNILTFFIKTTETFYVISSNPY